MEPEAVAEPPSPLGRVLGEPTLHFLLIGAALFGLYALVSGPEGADPEDRRIVVTEGKVQQLVALFSQRRQRPPTEEELQGLIDDHVLEEATYREALKMGLHEDDAVIRRRMQQKFEFLTEDVVATAEPGGAELAAYLEANPDTFRRGRTHTFQQVHFRPELPDVEALLKEELAALRGGKAPPGGGMLRSRYADADALAIDGTFGRGFAALLDPLPVGEWQGPLRSGLGFHLVRVEARSEGEVPPLAEIRDQVAREWAYAQQEALRRQTQEQVLSGYEVIVEGRGPKAAPGGDAR
jgi:parvulin-like peptidyl-prolyl isomerase